MKKIFTSIALAALTLAPSTASAESWEKTVANKADWDAAIAAIAGVPGESYVITLAYDENTANINTGNWKPEFTSGRIVIRSNETDYEKMPVLLARIDWAVDLVDNGVGNNFSLIFENVNLQYNGGNGASSGQIVYINKHVAPIDTIAFRNCDINNFPRTIFRTVPVEADIENQTDENLKSLDVFEMKCCRVHDANISGGNNWFSVVFGQPMNKIVFEDNLFYDIPYSKGVWQINRVKELGNNPVVIFNNNSIIAAQNKQMASAGFHVMDPGAYLGATATYYVNNNIFLAPQKGLRTLIGETEDGDETTYDGRGMMLNAEGGLIFASNNVVDPLGFQGWAKDNSKKDTETGETVEKFTYLDLQNEISVEEAGLDNWDEGAVFQDPANSIYFVQQSHKTFTMGTAVSEDGAVVEGGQPTYLGASVMYTDKPFPVKADVEIAIDGPKYITYNIKPEKPVYYLGEEITITLIDQNSMYRTFTEFEGWSDGDTSSPRTITLTGNVNLTAKFKEVGGSVVSAFTFTELPYNEEGKQVGRNNIVTMEANIYSDRSHKGTATLMIYDAETDAYIPVTGEENRFNWRDAKFGEDAAAEQMPVVSRKTPAEVRAVGKPDYLLFSFSTKGVAQPFFSAFVGTDNFGYKTQLADYSLDGITWTNFAKVELTSREAVFAGDVNGLLWGWNELKGKLPEEAIDKSTVYVRIIGDVSQDAENLYATNPAAGEIDTEANGMFEYVGNVLITDGEAPDAAISTVENGLTRTDNAVYDLQGRRLTILNARSAKPSKGLYIQSGKKFVVK